MRNTPSLIVRVLWSQDCRILSPRLQKLPFPDRNDEAWPPVLLHPCHYPYPSRAKLAQNFIIILLRLISSFEAPSVGKEEKEKGRERRGDFWFRTWFMDCGSTAWIWNWQDAISILTVYLLRCIVKWSWLISGTFTLRLMISKEYAVHQWVSCLCLLCLPICPSSLGSQCCPSEFLLILRMSDFELVLISYMYSHFHRF